MHTRNYIIIGTLVSALAFLGAACGDDIECGTGTIEVDGVCVPTDAVCGPNATWDDATGTCVGATCADGTTLVDGECVPDGSVICGDGTTYNETTGECDPDITECAEGTTEVDGVCVPNDDLLPDEADVTEGAEDNGWNGTPVSFSLPEVGEDRTIYGCVTPFLDEDEDGELDPDYDLYVFSITAPTLVNIKVDGIAGLSGGFEIYSLDEALADYWRVGMNLVDDVSERQVYLPKAGDYVLVISDSRSIWLRTAAGSADTCYFATVTHLAAPTPTAWTTASSKMCWDGTACTTAADCAGIGDMFGEETCDYRVQDSYSSDVTFYSYDTDEGDILRPWLATAGSSSEGALVNMRNGAMHMYSAATGTAGNPAQYWAAGYADDDTLTIVVDHVYNYALQPVDYMLDVYDPGAVPLAEDGSTATLTPGRYGNAYGYFDVADGEVDDVLMHHTISPPAGYSCYIIPPDESVYPSCSAENYDEWIQFVEGGRAYIEVSWTEEVDTIDVDSTITHVMPTAIEVGTLIDDAALPEHGNGWYELDVSASDWLVSTAPETTDFLGALAVDLYSRTNTGVIDGGLYSVDDFTLADPTEEVGRIVVDDDSVFLVRITDDAFDGTGDTETYDFLVDNRDYTDLGTIEVDTPIDEADLDISALGTEYFLLYADPADVAKVDITSTGDTPVVTVLATLDSQETEIDTAADATALESLVPAAGWVAFRVDDSSDNAGTFDLGINAYPPPYSWTEGTIAFTDVCSTGEAVTLSDDDDGLSTAAITPQFSFDLFGDAVTELTVSSNGWVTATPSYAGTSVSYNQDMPDPTEPNFLLAPFWDDGDYMVVCMLSEADKLTIQWTGEIWLFGEPLQFQTVIHDDGSFDFIYGPSHDGYGGGEATIGLENIDGTEATQISYNEQGVAAANTSYTFTPNY